MNVINFRDANCAHCYKCLRNCDVKAIRIKNGQAQIVQDMCIFCGHCTEICPQQAKTFDSDLEYVKHMLKHREHLVVSLDPSYSGLLNLKPAEKDRGCPVQIRLPGCAGDGRGSGFDHPGVCEADSGGQDGKYYHHQLPLHHLPGGKALSHADPLSGAGDLTDDRPRENDQKADGKTRKKWSSSVPVWRKRWRRRLTGGQPGRWTP